MEFLGGKSLSRRALYVQAPHRNITKVGSTGSSAIIYSDDLHFLKGFTPAKRTVRGASINDATQS